MSYKTEQEEFWAGDFGDEYIGRNRSEWLLASNIHWFSRMLAQTTGVESVLELGANVGMNLRALRTLLPDASLDGVEINEQAAAQLRSLELGKVWHGSILDQPWEGSYDLVFTKTVLIHIAPAELQAVYEAMAAASKRYVLIAEYYNPAPTSITYRGHERRLFKRDFGGEFLEANPGFELANYAFSYSKDPVFPQDDISWFLYRRR